MRLSAKSRRSQIVQIGLTIAATRGLAAVTHERVSADGPDGEMSVSVATVRRYFHTLDDLRGAVAAHPDASVLVRQESKVLGISITRR